MVSPLETFLSPNLIHLLITLVIPFLIIFSVLLFALKRTNVFGSGKLIYIILSLGLTVMIAGVNPGNVFNFLASYLVQLGVMGSVFALVTIFIIAVWSVIKMGANAAQSLQSDQQKLHNLEKIERDLQKKYYSTGILGMGGSSTGQRLAISKQLEDIEKEKKFLLAKMKNLRA